MAYEQKELGGALFKNDKGDNQSRPDYRGDCKIGGVEYRIAAWLKDGNKGKFMSLKFSVKDDAAEPPKPQGAAPRPAPKDDFGDSDIPF